MSDGFQYSVVFVNDSTREGDVCLYQTLVTPVTGGMSVAWFAQHAFPTTTIVFSWELTNAFVWSETGTLGTDAMMVASQVWPADPFGNNTVTLVRRNNAYTFQDARSGLPSGSLIVVQDSSLPANRVATGIGVAQRATYVVQAQPNVQTVFKPQSRLWITFGTFTRGQVIDPATLQSQEIVFPVNIYSMTATLRSDNTWSVQPTSSMNAALARARQTSSTARFGTQA